MAIGIKCTQGNVSGGVGNSLIKSILDQKLNRDIGLSNVYNVNSELNLSTEAYTGPSYTISGTCFGDFSYTGTTIVSGVTGVTTYYNTSGCTYNVSEVDNIPIVFNLTGSTQYTGYTGQFCYKVFGLNSVLINQDCTIYSGITGGTIVKNLDFSSVGSKIQREFKIRAWNVFDSLTIDNLTIDTSIYNPVDDSNDCYFVTTTNPPKPTLRLNNIDDFTKDFYLINEVLDVNDEGPTPAVKTSYKPTGTAVILVVNGVVMSTLDYTVTEYGLINFNVLLEPEDRVQAIYYAGTPVSADGKLEALVVNTITSGVTASTTNILNINPTQGDRLEFFTQEPMANTPIIQVNGVTLQNDVDYYLSTVVPNKVNFAENVPIDIGDIISILYVPFGNTDNGFLGKLLDNNVTINWNVNGNVGRSTETDGYFVVEITSFEDLNYDNILYTSSNIDFVFGSIGYTVDMGPITTSNVSSYIYRVRFIKNFNTRLYPKTYTTESVSDNGSFIIDWNYINSTNF